VILIVFLIVSFAIQKCIAVDVILIVSFVIQKCIAVHVILIVFLIVFCAIQKCIAVNVILIISFVIQRCIAVHVILIIFLIVSCANQNVSQFTWFWYFISQQDYYCARDNNHYDFIKRNKNIYLHIYLLDKEIKYLIYYYSNIIMNIFIN
jgi:hypothetical protein